jgi:hypothetical protein
VEINRGKKMTLDLVCIKKILTYIDNNDGIVENTGLIDFLMEILGSEKKSYYYLKIMKEIRLIDSSDKGLGFCWENEMNCKITKARIEMTFLGQKTLECLRNQDLMARINKGANDVNFTRLQNIPALTIQAIFQKI